MTFEKRMEPRQYLEGFEECSEFVGSAREFTVFRRFNVLAARSLLYLQGELLALEATLKELDKQDLELCWRDTDEALRVNLVEKDWASFERESNSNEHHRRKMEVVLRLRRLMKEYREHPLS